MITLKSLVSNMHYYQFNIGDYLSHTRHLTPTEDLCYRRLLDYYYLHEKPIPLDALQVTRLICLNKEFMSDVKTILNEFFVETNIGWINPRADKEIQQYQSFSDAGKRGAAKRWSKDGNGESIGGLSGGVSGVNAKQETLNNNHKPIKYTPPIPAELLAEWLVVRKKKPVTERIFNAIENQARLLGWSAEQAIIKCCEQGWTGFDASWVDKPKSKSYQDERLSVSNAAFGNLLNKYSIEEKEITND